MKKPKEITEQDIKDLWVFCREYFVNDAQKARMRKAKTVEYSHGSWSLSPSGIELADKHGFR